MLGPEADMPDFIVKDSFKDGAAARIAGRAHTLQHWRRYIKPSCFQHHRHHRQPRCDIVARAKRGFPKPVMRRQRSIVAAKGAQMPVEQHKMHRFVGSNREKFGHEFPAHFGTETPCDIERQINRDKFNMRQRVEQCDAASQGLCLAAPRHVARCQQVGMLGPPRMIGHRLVEREIQPPQPPIACRRARRHHFLAHVAGAQRCVYRFCDGPVARMEHGLRCKRQLKRLCRLQHLLCMVLHAHLVPNLGNFTFFINQVGGAHHAHIGAAVILLLGPDP